MADTTSDLASCLTSIQDRSNDIEQAISTFDLQLPWQVLLEKYGQVIAQYQKLKDETDSDRPSDVYKIDLKSFTVFPKKINLSYPDYVPNLLSVYPSDWNQMIQQQQSLLESKENVDNMDTIKEKYNQKMQDLIQLFCTTCNEKEMNTNDLYKLMMKKQVALKPSNTTMTSSSMRSRKVSKVNATKDLSQYEFLKDMTLIPPKLSSTTQSTEVFSIQREYACDEERDRFFIATLHGKGVLSKEKQDLYDKVAAKNRNDLHKQQQPPIKMEKKPK